MAQKLTDRLKTPEAVKWFWIIISAPFAVLIFLLILTGLGLFGKLPSFEELENPRSNIATEIYSEDGVLLGSFFIQNRSYVDYTELSPNLVAALVSTEDSRFYTHSGIDFISLARVAVKTVGMGQRGEGGGSTITQQLAKNLYPRDTVARNTISRHSRLVVSKLKEWITAVMLEHNYTKEEIIAMYLNTVEYGSNAWGIKSAARTFFNKTPAEVNVQEAAMLVGVVNKPTRYSPVRNPDYAKQRRNTVISRMRDQGYLTRAERDSVSALEIELDYRPISHNEGAGTYFREMLRMVMTMKRPSKGYMNDWDYPQALDEWDNNPLYGWCLKNTNVDGVPYNLYRDGLRIYTTINSKMQRYAEQAVEERLSTDIQPRMDAQIRRTGRVYNNLTVAEATAALERQVRQTERYRALNSEGMSEGEIMKIMKTPVEMTLFSYSGDKDTVMSPYDSVLYYKKFLRASFMAMDPSNGHVKAYVGGPNYRYFKYDMVKQGKRQVGSTIKPFVYTFAIDQLGVNPCTMVQNVPYAIETSTGEPWQPREATMSEDTYDELYHPLWWGLQRSRNNYSTWIMKLARQPQAVADYIHKMGIHSWIDPVDALCLGTSDFSLYEMVGAYSTFANKGVHTEPVFVTRIADRHDNTLAVFSTQSQVAVNEQTAYTMLDMLERVINAGTGYRMRSMYNIKAEMGGKTGTSQNNADAWFMGVTPKLVGGAWVGGDENRIFFSSGGEGAAVALPIFADFMKKVYADPKLGISENDKFLVPQGVVIYDCEAVGTPPPSGNNDDFFN